LQNPKLNFPNFLYSGQNEALHSKQLNLAEKPNFALRHDTQTLKNTHYNTVLLTYEITSKQYYKKTVIRVACGTPQYSFSLNKCTIEYSTIEQRTTKRIILPQHPVFGLGQSKEPLQHHRLYTGPGQAAGGNPPACLIQPWHASTKIYETLCPCVIVHEQDTMLKKCLVMLSI